VDDRIKISAPVNMISFISQGGGCQEAANLRIDTNNVMFAAMMAPRPLLMVSASGDWTHNTPREEFPAVQSIYRLFDAAQNVEQLQIDSPHNYNQPSREAVYAFFGARLLNLQGPVPEQRFRAEQVQDLLAMYGRTRPANAVTMQQYVEDRIAEARQDTDVLRPRGGASLTRAREAFQERLAFSLLASTPLPREVISAKLAALPGGEKLLLGRAGKGDRIPSVWLSPRKLNPDIAPTLIVHSEGVAPILSSAESKDGLVKGILDRGGVVLAIDSFQTGSAKAPRDTEERGFTVYNRTNDANRVQDILTAITYLKERSKSSTVNLIGLEDAGVWTLFARALAGSGVNLAADLNRFQTDSDREFLEKFFVPGVRRAGDFRAAAVLATQGKLLIHNAGGSFPADWVRDSARIGGFPAEVRAGKMPDSELVSWAAPIIAENQSQNPGSTH
jgi:hypothetical protein